MAPLLRIDPDDEKSFNFAPGVHRGKILSVTDEENKAHDGRNLVWKFELTDSHTGETGQITSWNPRKKGTRSQNGPWLRQLGMNPDEFDPDALAGFPVAVETVMEDDKRNPGTQIHRVKNVVRG